MRNLLKFLVIAPLALIFLIFALANRQTVVVSFDPFNGGDIPSPQIVLPLFIVLIVAAMVGEGSDRGSARRKRNPARPGQGAASAQRPLDGACSTPKRRLTPCLSSSRSAA
jgi:hypothetical protein